MSKAQDLAKLFEATSRLSSFIDGGILISPNSAILKLSVHDPSQSKSRDFYKSLNTHFALTSCKESSFNSTRTLRLVLQEGEKKEDICWELWNKNRIIQVKDLKKSHLVLTSSLVFGRISWSSDDQLVVYTAEATAKKSANFWSGEENAGNQHWYKEHFGEGLKHVTDPKLFVYKIEANEVVEVKSPENVYPAQAVFRPGTHDLFFIGFEKFCYKLGIAAMLNRKTKLFKTSFPSEVVEEVKFPAEFMAVLYPKFSPNGRFLSFLGVPAGSLAHAVCVALLIQDLQTDEIRVLIPQIHEFSSTFNGIYGFHDTLATYNWIDDETLVFATPHDANESVFKVSLSGEIQELALPLAKPYAASILDVHTGAVLVKCSSFTVPEQVFILTKESGFEPVLIENTAHEELSAAEKELKDKLKEVQTQIICNENSPVKSVLYHKPGNTALLAVIHGGPHSAGVVGYSVGGSFRLLNNVNVLVVNYSGSLGFGEGVLESLLGRIGELDVSDCVWFIEKAKEICPVSHVVAYGGSHGGFLSAHLASRIPLSGSVIINGVTDIASMLLTTDITDWGYAEVSKTEIQIPPSSEQYSAMYKASPISRANQISCPVLICAGNADLRVPPLSSPALFRVLKANQKECKMLWYNEQGHGILGKAEGYDLIVNSMAWIDEMVSRSG